MLSLNSQKIKKKKNQAANPRTPHYVFYDSCHLGSCFCLQGERQHLQPGGGFLEKSVMKENILQLDYKAYLNNMF